MEYSDNKLAAIAIIKRTLGENKICNLTVLNDYKNRGIGIKLIKRCFRELGTKKPFFTISEEKLPEFAKIIKYFDFKKSRSVYGLYRKNKVEYFYNEITH